MTSTFDLKITQRGQRQPFVTAHSLRYETTTHCLQIKRSQHKYATSTDSKEDTVTHRRYLTETRQHIRIRIRNPGFSRPNHHRSRNSWQQLNMRLQFSSRLFIGEQFLRHNQPGKKTQDSSIEFHCSFRAGAAKNHVNRTGRDNQLVSSSVITSLAAFIAC